DAPLLITQQALLDRLGGPSPRVLCIDADQEALACESEEDPPAAVGADNLCYVIYTSGSTGRPKGAMNTHGGIVNPLLWMQAASRLGSSGSVLPKAPFGFDVSVWEFFWPLLAGARLVVAKPGGHQDGGYLADIIGREGVSTLHFVPSMLSAFLSLEDLSP